MRVRPYPQAWTRTNIHPIVSAELARYMHVETPNTSSLPETTEQGQDLGNRITFAVLCGLAALPCSWMASFFLSYAGTAETESGRYFAVALLVAAWWLSLATAAMFTREKLARETLRVSAPLVGLSMMLGVFTWIAIIYAVAAGLGRFGYPIEKVPQQFTPPIAGVYYLGYFVGPTLGAFLAIPRRRSESRVPIRWRRALLLGVSALLPLCFCGPPRRGSLFALPAPKNQLFAVAISPDGRTLASGGHNQRVGAEIQLWDLQTRQQLRFMRSRGERTKALAFSPEGALLYSGGDHGAIDRWQVSDGTLLDSLRNGGPIDFLAITPDGRTLVSAKAARDGGDEGLIRVWDLENKKVVRTLSGKGLESMALSADGRTLVCGRRPLAVEIFVLASGLLKDTLTPTGESSDAVTAVAMTSADGLLATGTGGGFIEIWDLPSGRSLSAGSGHPTWTKNANRIVALAFSRDRRFLASAGLDGTIRLWNVRDRMTWKTLAALSDHSSFRLWFNPMLATVPCCLSFSPKNDLLASGDLACLVRAEEDKCKVRVWALPSAD